MADVVIGVAFGVRSRSPGESNKVIGKKVKEYSESYGVPIIAQEEVALTLSEEIESEVEIILGNLPWKKGGSYGDTHDVAVEAKKIADERDWGDSAVLICHSDHLWRSKRIFRKQGFNLIIPPARELAEIPYDPKSYQRWTRNKWSWWSKEIIYSIPFDKIRGYY